MATLRIIDGPGEGEHVTLGEYAALGRFRGCELQIKDPESSRRHAEIILADGEYRLRDLGSSNGTLLNGTRITEVTLRHGDHIEIGTVAVQFVDEEAGTSDTPVPPAPEEPVDEPELADVTPVEEPSAGEADLPEFPGYKTIKPLAEDELSVTYLATELAMSRPVAIQIIAETYTSDPEDTLARIRRAAQLEHPAGARVYFAGCEENRVYLSREPATGQSMWEVCGKLPPEEIVPAAVAVAGALEEAHGVSVLHGSLRPDRIVRTHSGNIKLLGLGLPAPSIGALCAEPDLQRRPSRIAYMAPEQLAGDPPTERTDIYSLGAVLYHMICGRTPFTAVSEAELAPKISSESIAPVLDLRPQTPGPLARTVDRMLARDPAARPGSMADVGEELEAVLRREEPAPEPVVVLDRAAEPAEPPASLDAKSIIILILGALLLASVALLGKVTGGRFVREAASALEYSPAADDSAPPRGQSPPPAGGTTPPARAGSTPPAGG